MLIMQLGGAVARVPEDATAFGGRDAAFQIAIIGVWDDPGQKPASVQWSRDSFTALQAHSRGTYVNFAGNLDEAGLKASYGPEKYARLQRVKTKYDPENLFHLHHNIKPAG
jgi:hypothetical protein